MKHAALLFLLLCSAAGCAKEDVRASIGKGLETSCRDNPATCTLSNPDSVTNQGRGAQR